MNSQLAMGFLTVYKLARSQDSIQPVLSEGRFEASGRGGQDQRRLVREEPQSDQRGERQHGEGLDAPSARAAKRLLQPAVPDYVGSVREMETDGEKEASVESP